MTKLGEEVIMNRSGYISKNKVKQAIEKHFVCGYFGNGFHDEKRCRKCKLLKELGLDKGDKNENS